MISNENDDEPESPPLSSSPSIISGINSPDIHDATAAFRRLSLPSTTQTATAWDLMARELTPERERRRGPSDLGSTPQQQQQQQKQSSSGLLSSKEKNKRRQSSLGVPTLSSRNIAKLPSLLNAPEKEKAPSQKTLLSSVHSKNSITSNHNNTKNQRRASVSNGELGSSQQQDKPGATGATNTMSTSAAAAAAAGDDDSAGSDEMLYLQESNPQQEKIPPPPAQHLLQLQQTPRTKSTRRHSTLGSVPSPSSSEIIKRVSSAEDKEEAKSKGSRSSSTKPELKKAKSSRRHSALGSVPVTHPPASSEIVKDEELSKSGTSFNKDSSSRHDALKRVKSSRRHSTTTGTNTNTIASVDSTDSADSTTKKTMSKNSSSSHLSSKRNSEMKKQKSSRRHTMRTGNSSLDHPSSGEALSIPKPHKVERSKSSGDRGEPETHKSAAARKIEPSKSTTAEPEMHSSSAKHKSSGGEPETPKPTSRKGDLSKSTTAEPETHSSSAKHKRSSSGKRRLLREPSSEPPEQPTPKPPPKAKIATISPAEPSPVPSGSSEATSRTGALTPTSSFSSTSHNPTQRPPAPPANSVACMSQYSPASAASGSSSSAARNVPKKSILKTKTGGVVDLAGERRFSSTGLLPGTRRVQSSHDLMRLSAAPQPPQRVLERRKSETLAPAQLPQRSDTADALVTTNEPLLSAMDDTTSKKDASASEHHMQSPSTSSHSSSKKKKGTSRGTSGSTPVPPPTPVPQPPPLLPSTPPPPMTKSILKTSDQPSSAKSILKHTKETPRKNKSSDSLPPGPSPTSIKVDFSGERRFSSTGVLLKRSSSAREFRTHIPSLYHNDDESEEESEGEDDVLSQAKPSARVALRRQQSMDMIPTIPRRRTQSNDEEDNVEAKKPAAMVDSPTPQKADDPSSLHKSIIKKTHSASRSDSDDVPHTGDSTKASKSRVRSKSVENYTMGRAGLIPSLDDEGHPETPNTRRRGGTRPTAASRRYSLDLVPAIPTRTSGSSVGSLGSASNHSNLSVPRVKSTYSGHGVLLRCEQTMHDLSHGSIDSKSTSGSTTSSGSHPKTKRDESRSKKKASSSSSHKKSSNKEKDKKTKGKKSSSSKSKYPDDISLLSLPTQLLDSGEIRVSEDDELDNKSHESTWDWQDGEGSDEDERRASNSSLLDQYRDPTTPGIGIIPDTPQPPVDI